MIIKLKDLLNEDKIKKEGGPGSGPQGNGDDEENPFDREPSDDELKAYVNGTQVGSTVGSLGTFSGTIDDMDLGRNPADGAYFKGQIDEVSIWTSVMNITTLYNGGKRRKLTAVSDLDITKLAAYYPMEEGSGTTTNDKTTNRNHGNLNNTPTWTAL